MLRKDSENHKNECEYEVNYCKHCWKTYISKEMQNHLENECDSFPMKCEYEGCE